MPFLDRDLSVAEYFNNAHSHINPPTLEDHSQPLNVQYVVHIAFVHINHTDQFKYSFMESSEVTGDHCKNNYLQLQCWVQCLYTMYN